MSQWTKWRPLREIVSAPIPPEPGAYIIATLKAIHRAKGA